MTIRQVYVETGRDDESKTLCVVTERDSESKTHVCCEGETMKVRYVFGVAVRDSECETRVCLDGGRQ